MYEDVYTAIPLQKGQISCRELMSGEKLLVDLKKDAPIKIDMIDSAYATNPALQKIINERGL
jgi:N-acetylneuraminate synthase